MQFWGRQLAPCPELLQVTASVRCCAKSAVMWRKLDFVCVCQTEGASITSLLPIPLDVRHYRTIQTALQLRLHLGFGDRGGSYRCIATMTSFPMSSQTFRSSGSGLTRDVPFSTKMIGVVFSRESTHENNQHFGILRCLPLS